MHSHTTLNHQWSRHHSAGFYKANNQSYAKFDKFTPDVLTCYLPVFFSGIRNMCYKSLNTGIDQKCTTIGNIDHKDKQCYTQTENVEL